MGESLELFKYYNKKAKKYTRNQWKQEDKRLNQFKKIILDMSFDELQDAKEIFEEEVNYLWKIEKIYNPCLKKWKWKIKND